MKVIVTRSTVADGKRVEASSTPVEMSDKCARLLIAMKKAVVAPDKPAAPKKAAKADK